MSFLIAGYSAFGAAMAAKRSFAQSLARELGPRGVHVAHVIIDGPIDTFFVRQRMNLLFKNQEVCTYLIYILEHSIYNIKLETRLLYLYLY